MTAKHWPGSGAQYDAPTWVATKATALVTDNELTGPGFLIQEQSEPAGVLKHYGTLIPEDQLDLTVYTFQSVFQDIFNEAFTLLVERQRKYGPDNIRQLGVFGVFSRLAYDKIERIKRSLNGEVLHGEVLLSADQDFDDESLEDALLDVANYALILIALKRGVWGAPLE